VYSRFFPAFKFGLLTYAECFFTETAWQLKPERVALFHQVSNDPKIRKTKEVKSGIANEKPKIQHPDESRF